jgi:hypothetical protein
VETNHAANDATTKQTHAGNAIAVATNDATTKQMQPKQMHIAAAAADATIKADAAGS